MEITLRRPSHKSAIQGFDAFADVLEAAYSVSDMPSGKLKWVEVKPVTFREPDITFHPSGNSPSLSVVLRPVNKAGEQLTTREEIFYNSPLFVYSIEQLKDCPGLKDYKIDRWRGRPGPETMFKKSRSLAEIIEMDYKGDVTDQIQVVELACLLPMSATGEFETEFNPYICMDPMKHTYYQINTIAENSQSFFATLTQGRNGEVKDIDDHQKTYSWKAVDLSRLSDLERQMTPSSKGHMILIATPVQSPSPKSFFYPNNDINFGEDISRGGLTRGGITIGQAALFRGTQSGTAKIYEGEIVSSREGSPIIYHINFLTATPDTFKGLPDLIPQIESSMGNYEHN